DAARDRPRPPAREDGADLGADRGALLGALGAQRLEALAEDGIGIAVSEGHGGPLQDASRIGSRLRRSPAMARLMAQNAAGTEITPVTATTMGGIRKSSAPGTRLAITV